MDEMEYENMLLASDDEEDILQITKKVTIATNQEDDLMVTSSFSSFCDFPLKPQILRAIADCGFKNPSEVQTNCMSPAVFGMDILCQSKSGMGKTAVFVLSTLQQLEPIVGQVHVLVMCHTRELAFQISNEYKRFSKYLLDSKVAVFFGGRPIRQDIQILKNNCPNIVIGTPGRIFDLVRSKKLNLRHLKHFILDECDQMLESKDMRKDVQQIYFTTPHNKQVMMFSASLSTNIKLVCKKFMKDPLEVYVDDVVKLSLDGLQQYYVKLSEREKNQKLFVLLHTLEFEKVIIFVRSVKRCMALTQLLTKYSFPAIGIHSAMLQKDRLSSFQDFKNSQERIMVASNLVQRGIDIAQLNIVINYDIPENADSYLHRVARAGRHGTKGLAITFVSNAHDAKILRSMKYQFNVNIAELPDHID